MNRFIKGAGAMVLAIGMVLSSGLPAVAQEGSGAAAELQAMARSASTSADHAAVARQYRLQAELFAAKADEHEATAKRLTRTAGPLMHKWPALAPKRIQTEKSQAVSARRASEENRRLADHHVRMSVELLAAAR